MFASGSASATTSPDSGRVCSTNRCQVLYQRESRPGCFDSTVWGFFKSLLSKETELSCGDLGWTFEQVRKLAALVEDGLYPTVRTVDLSHNAIGHGEDANLSCMAQFMGIKDGNLQLEHTGLQASSMKQIAMGIPSTGFQCTLLSIDLSQNAIGDEGVRHIASILVQVKSVELTSIGATNESVLCLTKELQSRKGGHSACMRDLVLDNNLIDSTELLDSLGESSDSIVYLSASHNPGIPEYESEHPN